MKTLLQIFFSVSIILFAAVTAFAQTPGTVKWAFATRARINSSPAIDVGADGTIYVGSEDGKLYAINPDGTAKWIFTTGSGDVDSSPAIGPDGTIYVGSGSGFLSDIHKLSAITPEGMEKWAFIAGANVESSPAIGPDGTIYVGCDDSKLYAINSDGTQKWAFNAGSAIYSSPALGTDGVIYVGTEGPFGAGNSGSFFAINPDGTRKWTFTTPEGRIRSSPAIGADGTVYVWIGGPFIFSANNGLYAFNPDGTRKWFFRVETTDGSSPVIGADGTIYVGTGFNVYKLYALNPDGTEKWSFRASFDVDFTTPAITMDGTIYAGTNGGVFAINPDGTQKWMLLTESIYSSLTVSSDGTIYIGTDSGKLYAIYSDSYGLAFAPWPKFRANERNWGRFEPQPQNEVGVIAIDVAQTVEFGSSIQIQVRGKNFGTQAQSNFPISYQIDNDVPITETFSETLQPNTTAAKIFATPWVPADTGSYTIKARTGLAGDQRPGTDAVTKFIKVVFAHDIGIAGLDLPKITNISDSTAIRVRVTNFGNKLESNFSVSYQINAEPPITENFPGTLAPSQTATMSFSKPWVPPAFGAYQVTIRTHLNLDQNTSNNVSLATVQVFNFWRGVTSQNLPIVFNVNPANVVDTVAVDILIDWGTVSCVYTFSSSEDVPIQNGMFEVTVFGLVFLPSGSPSPKVRGLFTSPTSCIGKVDDFLAAGGFCGGRLIVGTGSSQGEKTWNANGKLLNPLDVKDPALNGLPTSFTLSQNYPNPFNPATVIEYTLPISSHVELKIYDILGNEVRVLVSGKQPADVHRVQFDSEGLPGGVYFYRLRAGERVEVKKMVIVR